MFAGRVKSGRDNPISMVSPRMATETAYAPIAIDIKISRPSLLHRGEPKVPSVEIRFLPPNPEPEENDL
jgi:hypothetical protein